MSDAGDESPPKPCCRRVLVLGVHPGWCYLADGHDGDCRGTPSSRPRVLPNFMPRKR